MLYVFTLRLEIKLILSYLIYPRMTAPNAGEPAESAQAQSLDHHV